MTEKERAHMRGRESIRDRERERAHVRGPGKRAYMIDRERVCMCEGGRERKREKRVGSVVQFTPELRMEERFILRRGGARTGVREIAYVTERKSAPERERARVRESEGARQRAYAIASERAGFPL